MTSCAASPESGFAIPPYTSIRISARDATRRVHLSVKGDAGTAFGPFPFEVHYTLGPGGSSLTGIGVVADTLWTVFVTGERVP